MTIDRAEKYRITYLDDKHYGTRRGSPFGAFQVKGLRIIVAPLDMEWEHVSVSRKHRVPNWQEMCFVKDLFWDKEETVIQFHPKLEKYVDTCGTCLHLWRHKKGHDLPPTWLV